MPNENNLVSLAERTTSEQREIAQKGGFASGVARRRKKALKEAADLYLSLPVQNRKTWNDMAKKGVPLEDIDNQMSMIVGLHRMAELGDARCAKVLIDLLGEDAREDGDGGVVIVDDIS